MLKEKCVGSYVEAVEAQKLGADRIELCDNLEEGGTTPSYGTIKKSVEDLEIPVFVIIRPRGGDFVYSKEEVEIMKEDIKIAKNLGASGVVLGVLSPNNTIDYERTSELVEVAKPMSVTFHKAIDEIFDPSLEVSKLSQIGVDRILTSGTKETALEGAYMIKKMIEVAQDEIEIVVAGKVTRENFDEVHRLIGAGEYHGKKIV